MAININIIREQFPALAITDEGKARIYLDNPGGTQVPRQVLERMERYLIHTNANHGGPFRTSIESDLVLEEELYKRLFNCSAIFAAVSWNKFSSHT